ncbi:PspC domain-containing protein [Pontibacillus salicampi]|uniref:PspC domain-containing protein n=1 Tax=Pontibacillus salicampi TaxID=1449801 RepID=A0ABV6LTA4_9BACI
MKDRKLMRSKDKKMLSGVLGGLSDYMNFDVTIIRLIFALLTILSIGFPMIIVYIIAAVIIPEEGDVVS